MGVFNKLFIWADIVLRHRPPLKPVAEPEKPRTDQDLVHYFTIVYPEPGKSESRQQLLGRISRLSQDEGTPDTLNVRVDYTQLRLIFKNAELARTFKSALEDLSSPRLELHADWSAFVGQGFARQSPISLHQNDPFLGSSVKIFDPKNRKSLELSDFIFQYRQRKRREHELTTGEYAGASGIITRIFDWVFKTADS